MSDKSNTTDGEPPVKKSQDVEIWVDHSLAQDPDLARRAAKALDEVSRKISGNSGPSKEKE